MHQTIQCKENWNLLCEIWILGCEPVILTDKGFPSGKTCLQHLDFLCRDLNGTHFTLIFQHAAAAFAIDP